MAPIFYFDLVSRSVTSEDAAAVGKSMSGSEKDSPCFIVHVAPSGIAPMFAELNSWFTFVGMRPWSHGDRITETTELGPDNCTYLLYYNGSNVLVNAGAPTNMFEGWTATQVYDALRNQFIVSDEGKFVYVTLEGTFKSDDGDGDASEYPRAVKQCFDAIAHVASETSAIVETCALTKSPLPKPRSAAHKDTLWYAYLHSTTRKTLRQKNVQKHFREMVAPGDMNRSEALRAEYFPWMPSFDTQGYWSEYNVRMMKQMLRRRLHCDLAVDHHSQNVAIKRRGLRPKAPKFKKTKQNRKASKPGGKRGGVQKPMKQDATMLHFLRNADGIQERGDEQKKWLDEGVYPPTEVTRDVWKYINLHGLKDPDKKQFICPDTVLSSLIGNEKLHMYDLGKTLSAFIVRT